LMYVKTSGTSDRYHPAGADFEAGEALHG